MLSTLATVVLSSATRRHAAAAALAGVLLAAMTTAAADGGEARVEVVPLEARELLAPGPELAPSRKATQLAGKRVRLVGFMAELEEPPAGAFYLVSRPMHCDESGAGTADLPPDAVRVVVRSATGEVIPFLPGPIEVTGILAVGNQTDGEGRPSAFRLVLDRREDLGIPPPSPATP